MPAIHCSALLFDLDGVLIDSTPAVQRVWHRWAVEHGLDPEAVVYMAHGRPSRSTIRELCPTLISTAKIAKSNAAKSKTSMAWFCCPAPRIS